MFPIELELEGFADGNTIGVSYDLEGQTREG